MFNLDLGLFNLREFPLVTDVFSSKRLLSIEGYVLGPMSGIVDTVSSSLRVFTFIYQSGLCHSSH